MHFANFADMQQISKARGILKEQGAEEKVLNYIKIIGGGEKLWLYLHKISKSFSAVKFNEAAGQESS